MKKHERKSFRGKTNTDVVCKSLSLRYLLFQWRRDASLAVENTPLDSKIKKNKGGDKNLRFKGRQYLGLGPTSLSLSKSLGLSTFAHQER